MSELTARQKEVLTYISREIHERGRPPTLRGIAAHFGWSSDNAARNHLRALRREGAIEYDGGTARGIRLPQHAPTAPLRDVPLVGKVAAGIPIEAIENVEAHIGVDPHLFPEEETFMLRVSGDSMYDAGIRNGDLALVRKSPSAQNGDLVVALLDGEATLKRYRQEGGTLVLQAENPDYEDIPVTSEHDYQLIGVVIGIIRRVEEG